YRSAKHHKLLYLDNPDRAVTELLFLLRFLYSLHSILQSVVQNLPLTGRLVERRWETEDVRIGLLLSRFRCGSLLLVTLLHLVFHVQLGIRHWPDVASVHQSSLQTLHRRSSKSLECG